MSGSIRPSIRPSACSRMRSASTVSPSPMIIVSASPPDCRPRTAASSPPTPGRISRSVSARRVVGFAEQGYVLARNGSVGVTVDTVNVDKVAVEVLRVGDRILPSMVSQLRSKPDGDRWTLENMVENSARPVWSGEMEVQGPHNATLHTAFPLAQAVTDRQPGAYLIVAANAAGLTPRTRDTKFLWQRTEDYHFAVQWVVVTDIALTSVTASDGLHVFARSLATARAVTGVGDRPPRPRPTGAGSRRHRFGRRRGLRPRPAARHGGRGAGNRLRLWHGRRFRAARPDGGGVRPVRPRRRRPRCRRPGRCLRLYGPRHLPAGRDDPGDGTAARPSRRRAGRGAADHGAAPAERARNSSARHWRRSRPAASASA